MTGRILVVEDEEHLARGLKFNLEAEGYKVQVAGDGETALGQPLGIEAWDGGAWELTERMNLKSE